MGLSVASIAAHPTHLFLWVPNAASDEASTGSAIRPLHSILHIHFPLLAYFEPKGAVAKQYRAYQEADGFCERALFVIDRKGPIFWNYLSPVAVNPGADGILPLEQLTKEASRVRLAS